MMRQILRDPRLFALLALLQVACAEDVLRQITTVTDEFEQNTAKEIDVLWVVDNSESMSEEQALLGQNFDTFIQNLVASDVDYHMGVVSTDPADGGQLSGPTGTPVITACSPGDPPACVDQARAAFLANVQVGITGSRRERAFETAATAIGKGFGWTPGMSPIIPVGNGGFVRNEAALFVIMVSDEDDESFGTVNYYRRLFESYKGPGNEGLISVSAIVGPPGVGGGCFVAGRGAAVPGDRYVDLATQTGGVWASICDDFTETLAELSFSASGLKAIFRLSKIPNPGAAIDCDASRPAFCVRVNGTVINEGNNRFGWVYDGSLNAIVFGTDNLPPAQAKITVEYQEARGGVQ